jgi:hypothetical protein
MEGDPEMKIAFSFGKNWRNYVVNFFSKEKNLIDHVPNSRLR